MQQYTGFGSRAEQTPQTEALAGTNQVQNNAGGFSFAVDDRTRVQRFLILGSSSPTYYVSQRTLTKENLGAIERMIAVGRTREVIDMIVAVSHEGRAPSNDPALFALARCCASNESRYAYDALPQVARTGTHLLHFMAYVKQFRGRGRTHRRALRAWYNDKRAETVAFQALKYQSRDGWSQRDVLRLTRPRPVDAEHNAVYHWMTKGWDGATEATVPAEEALRTIWAYERAKQASEANEVADLILTYRLPREAVPTTHLSSVKVWEALLADMPMEAMIRNLATMTKHGVLQPMGETTALVVERLHQREAIARARLHPVKILAALLTYQSGRSVRGSATWTPIPQIIDALNDAFYLAFTTVVPSGKRTMLALDVSGSMGMGEVAGVPALTPRVAAAALSLVTAATEPHYIVTAFSRGFVPLTITPKQRLDDVVRMTERLPFDATDCAVPILWAEKHDVPVEAFVVYTDSETWAGSIHPVQALARYRKKTGIPAKLVVVGMVSNGFSIASPDDAGMLDVVGMDTGTPELISSFVRGEL